jgi:hypothetical protein
MVIFAFVLVGIINTVISKIPIIRVLAINLVLLVVIIYMFYINIRIHKATKN